MQNARDAKIAALALQLQALIGQQVTITTTVAYWQRTVEVAAEQHDIRETPIKRTTSGVITRVDQSASLFRVWFEPQFDGDIWLGTPRHDFLAGQPTDISVG